MNISFLLKNFGERSTISTEIGELSLTMMMKTYFNVALFVEAVLRRTDFVVQQEPPKLDSIAR